MNKQSERVATTSEQQFRIKVDSFWVRRLRDWFVFRYLVRIIWMWMTVGRRIRNAHQEAKRSGTIFYIDDLMGGGDV